MSGDPGSDPQVQPATSQPATQERVFLVVVDESPELRVALRYACRRAFRSNGRVAMVHVMEPTGFGDWIGVNQLMKDEARQQAEAVMQKMATEVNKLSGKMPMLYFREGDRRDELLQLIQEEPGISILVLAASTGPKGPGPLVSALTGKYVSKMRVPVTIVPGNLSAEDIENVA
ncbi:MAG TPA: universal stress protein [Dongiaceae bacterium]|jgi:nucleotide-binding universal stress UspA family protein|nr:universal stress protein [Dongiaceae bacterium]